MTHQLYINRSHKHVYALVIDRTEYTCEILLYDGRVKRASLPMYLFLAWYEEHDDPDMHKLLTMLAL